MRVLITGGAGFIGSNLARAALAAGCAVTVLDDLSTGDLGAVDTTAVRFVESSLLDPDGVDDALTGVDAVVHLAALPSVPRSLRDPLASHAANATGTLTLLEGIRRCDVRHLTVASSSSVYGLNPAMPKAEREWVRPLSPYAVSKLATEQYALAYQQSFGLNTLAFRFFNVYGPGQPAGHAYAAVIPTFVDALLDDRPLLVQGDGTQSRDFTFVGTVCSVLLEAAVHGVVAAEPVNLAFGTNTTLNQLIERLEEVSGRGAKIEYGDPRPGDVAHSQADNASLRSLFPQVSATGLDDGLRHTLEWFEAAR